MQTDTSYAKIVLISNGGTLHKQAEKSYTKIYTKKEGKNNKPEIIKVEFKHKDLVPSTSKRIINITRSQFISLGGQPSVLEKAVKEMIHDFGAKDGYFELI
jgi:hypothetical protein